MSFLTAVKNGKLGKVKDLLKKIESLENKIAQKETQLTSYDGMKEKREKEIEAKEVNSQVCRNPHKQHNVYAQNTWEIII